VDQGGVQDSPSHQDVPDDPVLGVEKEGVKLLLLKVPEEGPHPCEDIGGTSKGILPPLGLRRHPPPQLQGRHDAGGSGGPDARFRLQNTQG